MKNKKYLKTVVKGIVTVSSMLAVNDFLGYFAPTRSSQTIHRIGDNIAGLSLGYLVGQMAGDAVVAGIEKATAAYRGEELYSEGESNE